jgi:hypothetical protein
MRKLERIKESEEIVGAVLENINTKDARPTLASKVLGAWRPRSRSEMNGRQKVKEPWILHVFI